VNLDIVRIDAGESRFRSRPVQFAQAQKMAVLELNTPLQAL